MIGTAIGSRIVVFIPKENRERIFKGSVIVLIGAVVLGSFIAFRIIKPDPFMEYFILYIDASIIGIALILAGIFTIRPMQSRNGKTILGIITMAFGVIIIIIPLFHISIWWNAGLGARLGAFGMTSPFWLIGIIFFIVLYVYIRKEKAKEKMDKGVQKAFKETNLP